MTDTSAAAPVLHYAVRWLPPSEQFVWTQVTRSAHPAMVVSRAALENRDTFPVGRIWSLGALERLGESTARRRMTTAVLLAAVRRHRAELLHVQFGYGLWDVQGVLARSSVPMVVSLFGHDATTLARTHPEVHARCLPLAARIIVPSEFLAEAARRAGARHEQIRIAPPGVDTAYFSPTPLPDEPVVAFVGRCVQKKGLGVLLDAWPEVRAAVPDARLTILGSGDCAAHRVDVPGVELRIGSGRARVRETLRGARVVVSPSLTAPDGDSESLLLVNLEAQATGRPVVTTRHGGIPEFVDEGRTALVVGEGRPDELAAAITKILADDELARAMADAGPVWARRFDADHCAGAVDSVYGEILGTS